MKDIRCIIVEGPDNCGKDTMCEQVKALIQNTQGLYPIYLCPKFSKLIVNWQKEMKDLKKYVEDFVQEDSRERIMILNRSWFDEAVYGPIYRGYSEEDLVWLFDISEQVRPHILYVSLDSDPQTLSGREDGLSFSKGDVDKISQEREKFIELFNKVRSVFSHTLYINTCKVSKENMGQEIAKYLGL